MDFNIFKLHTDTLGRMSACIKYSMYGITSKAMREQIPVELNNIEIGDVVFISEKNISKNALFGPFYVTDDIPQSISIKGRKGIWMEIDPKRTSPKDLPYWVELENRKWCLLFDRTLSDKISIVWPNNWSKLNVNLPSWGIVSGDDAAKLLDFAMNNEVEAKEFLKRHKVF